MPDLLAGTTVKAQDTPVAQYDTEVFDEVGITSTTYIAGAIVVGVAFTAPTTGRVLVLWGGVLENNGSGVSDTTLLSAEVKTGSTLNAGTIVSAANDDQVVQSPRPTVGGLDSRIGACAFRVVSGLTPGNDYNAVTMHKVGSTGTGDVFARNIAVIPLP